MRCAGELQSEAPLPMIPIPPKTRQWDWSYTTVRMTFSALESLVPFKLGCLLFPPSFHYHSLEVTRDCKSCVKSCRDRQRSGRTGVQYNFSLSSDARRTRTLIGVSFKRIPSKTIQSSLALMSAESDRGTSASCSTSPHKWDSPLPVW